MATSTVEEFLGLRQQLKEMIRKRNRGILSDLSITNTITETMKKPQYLNYGGSFFGPSEPTIAKRVIQESKGFASIKPQDVLMKNKKYSDSRTRESSACESILKALEVKKKIQHLKMSRDYSFLDNDDSNHQPSNQTSLQSNGVSKDPKLPPRTPVKLSVECKKQLDGKTRTTTVLPGSSKTVEKKKPNGNTSSLNQNKNTTMHNSNSKPALNLKITSTQPAKSKGGVEKKPTENISKSKTKLSQPQAVPLSKVQSKKRVLETVSSEARRKQVEKSKKRQLSEDERALQIIRKGFKTERFIGRDDRDVGNMEAKYGDILKEERESAKLAREEDAKQLRLIQQEEAEERRKKAAKRQKLDN